MYSEIAPPQNTTNGSWQYLAAAPGDDAGDSRFTIHYSLMLDSALLFHFPFDE
ncbi:MAG TPA: hypothetical protein VKB46_03685 [Pyrinomonadaceae bacterium]|nr:hypothetical protein [Pyrinomonadaceae bacterium]